MTEPLKTDCTFRSLDLHPAILQGIEDAGFTHCTPIQAAALPKALSGHDVAGQAQTGTGKTAAFLIATFQHLLTHPPIEGVRGNPIRALILAPTRELAVQIHEDAQRLGAHTGLRMGVVFGGTGYETQRRRIQEGLDVLIGTPGRLIDYYRQRLYTLKAVQVVVIDEADRMFDLGFIRDVRYLLRRCPRPEKRLGLLFSATLSYRVTELAYEHMNDPELVRVEPERVTAEKVVERLYHTANEEKIPLLIGLLRRIQPPRSLIFVNTKQAAERVWAYLEGNGFKAGILSGDVPQKKRLRLLERFQRGELPVLVATDVAARGLHIPDITHVFNFDLPQDPEDYVHRIGRTARAGASGEAISFACETYVYSLPEIEAYIGHKIPVELVQDAWLVEPAPPVRRERVRRKHGHGRGGRRHAGGKGKPRRHGGRRHAGRHKAPEH
ncbi:MAG: ATP-dependent RNA helicase RhlB [Gammaproteobacteria bacterium]|nr:MAG: ATP-dependent RNA helicase RhlB [Gammaproteobacteria bacterium]